MSAAKYRAAILSIEGQFAYHVTLYCDGRQIADEYTMTRWGARWWARRTARRHERYEPHYAEYRFDV